jgi:hypothetical protein
MGIDESLVKEIVKRVLSVANPEKIILFGSAATGQMTRDSDIDLLVDSFRTHASFSSGISRRRGSCRSCQAGRSTLSRSALFTMRSGMRHGIGY